MEYVWFMKEIEKFSCGIWEHVWKSERTHNSSMFPPILRDIMYFLGDRYRSYHIKHNGRNWGNWKK